MPGLAVAAGPSHQLLSLTTHGQNCNGGAKSNPASDRKHVVKGSPMGITYHMLHGYFVCFMVRRHTHSRGKRVCNRSFLDKTQPKHKAEITKKQSQAPRAIFTWTATKKNHVPYALPCPFNAFILPCSVPSMLPVSPRFVQCS